MHRRSGLWIWAIGFVSLTLACPAVADAVIKPIRGTLSRPGYTVIALAASGKATAVQAPRRSFSLRPPAAAVTLQLRAPDGKYAGPVVILVERRGKRVIEGVRAGARLGKININASKGYARVAGRLSARRLDTSRWARAKKGVPIGNGRNDGLVRSKPPRHPPPGDLDADGVSDVLDIDANGNGIIDSVDHARTVAHAAQAALGPETDWVKFSLPQALWSTANADVPALAGAVNTALVNYGRLTIGIWPGQSVQLDCGGSNQSPPRTQGLSYCSRGGTGYLEPNESRTGTRVPFPDCCDPDGDGMGNLTPNPTPVQGPGGASALFLSTGATAAQIGTGDVLVERVADNGVLSAYTTSVQFVFASVPALASYSDGQGDSATVQYPVSMTGPGTFSNGFPVKAGPNGDVSVTLTFWRPQRNAIPPETAPWYDIGHLSYGAQIYGLGTVLGGCPDSAFSNPIPPLVPGPAADEHGGGALLDQSADMLASAANTLTFTLDLTKCLAAHGQSFNPGQTQSFDLLAKTCGSGRCTLAENGTGPDSASQVLSFTRQQ